MSRNVLLQGRNGGSEQGAHEFVGERVLCAPHPPGREVARFVPACPPLDGSSLAVL